MPGSRSSTDPEHKSPRESGEDSEDESEILEESPCGRWLKRREEVTCFYDLFKRTLYLLFPPFLRSFSSADNYSTEVDFYMFDYFPFCICGVRWIVGWIVFYFEPMLFAAACQRTEGWCKRSVCVVRDFFRKFSKFLLKFLTMKIFYT